MKLNAKRHHIPTQKNRNISQSNSIWHSHMVLFCPSITLLPRRNPTKLMTSLNLYFPFLTSLYALSVRHTYYQNWMALFRTARVHCVSAPAYYTIWPSPLNGCTIRFSSKQHKINTFSLRHNGTQKDESIYFLYPPIPRLFAMHMG